MFNLSLTFTGVNAYSYPEKACDPLLIVMPNATRLGRSKQFAGLPPHFPTVWAYDTQRNLVLLKYFLWDRLEITSAKPLEAPAPVSDPTKVLGIPASDAQPKLADGSRVSGQVKVETGIINSDKGPCTASKGKLQWPSGVGLEEKGLLQQVGLEISSGKPIELQLISLFGGAPRELDLSKLPAGAEIFIGNACAQDILGWPTNDVANEPDADFTWFDVLGGNFPAPRIVTGGCGVKSSEPVGEKLRRKIRQMLGANAGGGACGCQCIGCQVELI